MKKERPNGLVTLMENVGDELMFRVLARDI